MSNPGSPLESLTRRDFIGQAALGFAASFALPRFAAAADRTPTPATSPPFRIAAFEKHFFEAYSPGELAQTCDEMELDVELTVRPEGHIKPVNAADELPRMVEALAQRKRAILVIASSFVRPDDPYIEQTLRTAKRLGIVQYRHRGYSYVAGKPIKAQLADFHSQAKAFAAMNREIGITGLYQNHAGPNDVGAAIWDLDAMLGDIDPQDFGVALDVRHLMVEQGRAWPTAIRMIAPRVRALYVKSFKWERDHPEETSLADGIVTKAIIHQALAGRGALPVCLHNEYFPLKPVPFGERGAIVTAFRNDANILRGWLGVS
jgi:sugar phosphate isomerase/epimerase